MPSKNIAEVIVNLSNDGSLGSHNYKHIPEIEIISRREGNSPGEHALKISFEGEVLEISHKASDRSIFAIGAILAGKWLKDKPPGSYTMQDIYSS